MIEFSKQFRHFLSYLLVRFVVITARITPRVMGHFLAGIISQSFFYLLKKERARTLANVKRVYPEKSDSEIHHFALSVYRNLGISFFDSIKLPFHSKEKCLKYVGRFDTHRFDKYFAKGKGLIVLSGHLSAFELQTQFAQLLGVECVTVGSQLFDKNVDTLINSLRQRNNVSFISRDGAMRGILKSLKANKLFGVLIDQDTTNDGVFAPFLGELAWTPATSIKLALKHNIPILYLATARHEDKKYYIDIMEPRVTLKGDPKSDLLKIAADFNQFYGEAIRKHPEQWPWMHRRWKRSVDRYPDHPVLKELPKEIS